MRRFDGNPSVLAIAALFILTAPAYGGPASAAASVAVPLSWSTYLRAGPNETAYAVAELEHDTAVTVVSCDARWCRVNAGGATGYVDRDALDLARTLAPVPPARIDCVVAGQADNRGPIPTRFCSAPPASPAAPR